MCAAVEIRRARTTHTGAVVDRQRCVRIVYMQAANVRRARGAKLRYSQPPPPPQAHQQPTQRDKSSTTQTQPQPSADNLTLTLRSHMPMSESQSIVVLATPAAPSVAECRR